MRIENTRISCGVYQLSDVGHCPTDIGYKEALNKLGNDGAILIASVPFSWKYAIKFLKAKKFKQANIPIKNPNSGNKIVVFVKNIGVKERHFPRSNYY